MLLWLAIGDSDTPRNVSYRVKDHADVDGQLIRLPAEAGHRRRQDGCCEDGPQVHLQAACEDASVVVSLANLPGRLSADAQT